MAHSRPNLIAGSLIAEQTYLKGQQRGNAVPSRTQAWPTGAGQRTQRRARGIKCVMRSTIFACGAALVLSACAHSAGGGAPPPAAHYVSMGSSFAAGPQTGPAPKDAPPRCFRSEANYAHLLAARLDLNLTDVSCGGATSAHLLGPWNELAPQIDAVTSDTRLVTITIGGNDIAYVGNLVAASCEPEETIRAAGMAIPCPAPFPVSEEAYANLESNLRDAADEIAHRAPHARIIFIQYVTLVPQTPCESARFTEAEAAALRAVGARLAEVTARAARASGADVLAADELSKSHTTCDPDPWSLGLPRDYDEAQGAPWHPNRRGMAAIADALEASLRR